MSPYLGFRHLFRHASKSAHVVIGKRLDGIRIIRKDETIDSIENIRDFVRNEDYEFYSHAITEAKKDGVEPEDVVYVLLTGKIIERYPKRRRVLVYGTMLNGLPVHVVCDYSDKDITI